MKKVTAKDVERMRKRGKTVTRIEPDPIPVKEKETSLTEAIKEQIASNEKIALENQVNIEIMTDNVERMMNQRKGSYKHTVKRNNQGSITHVISDPVVDV